MKTCTEHHTVWLLLFNITCSIFAFSHFLMLLFGLSVNIKWQWFESLLHACVDTVFGLTETHWVWHLEIGERLHAAPLFIHLCMPLISHCPKPFCHSEWLFMDSWRGKEGSATLILLAKKKCDLLSTFSYNVPLFSAGSWSDTRRKIKYSISECVKRGAPSVPLICLRCFQTTPCFLLWAWLKCFF